MQSLTVEFQRFGDPTGVIRLSDRYIRTIGTTAPAEEVSFALSQEILDRGMDALDYRRFERAAGDPDAVRATAEYFLDDITRFLEDFLLGDELPTDGEGPFQIDIVTHALELAQLPFEILEESHPELVITRRIRQTWPPPKVNRGNVPKVLFAWAEPRVRPGSNRRMEVPHDRHLELFDKVLDDWGGVTGGAFAELENTTRKKLADALTEKHKFTHVHLLAHGVGPGPQSKPQGERINLTGKPAPSKLVALENEDGSIDRCAPDALAELFSSVPRPETFAMATCHSAEVDPVRSGGTLAHHLHAAGVPIVLASQLALTQDGSDELIRTFLAKIIEGDDPRVAVRACRDALRASVEKTYYDRVALVSYIHVGDDLESQLLEKRFKVSLAHLKAISREANDRVESAVKNLGSAKDFTPEHRAEAEEIRLRFAEVRERLDKHENDPKLTKAQREELRGLQASSLKREAEAAFYLGRALSGDDSREWQEHSREVLRGAADAYRRAAEVSRDHHWTWVQWLVLEAVHRGSLADLEEDWIVAKVAARDSASLVPPRDASESDQKDFAERAIWGWGSLCELYLLAPLVGRVDALSEAKECLDNLVRGSRALNDGFPITSTLTQLERYETWWGADANWKLPPGVIDHAKELHDHLKAVGEAD